MSICKEFDNALLNLNKDINNNIAAGVLITSSGESLVRTKNMLDLAIEVDDVNLAKEILKKRISTTDYKKEVVKRTSEIVKVIKRDSNSSKFDKNNKELMTIVDVVPVEDYVIVTLVNSEGTESKYAFSSITRSDTSYTLASDGSSVKVQGLGSAIADARKDVEESKTKPYSKAAVEQGKRLDLFKEALNDIDKPISPDVSSSTVDQVNLNDYSKDNSYENGNIERMKNTLDKLFHLDAVRVSNEYLNHIKGLFDSLHPYIYRDMSLMIQTDTDTNAGWVSYDHKMIGIDIAKRSSTSPIHQSAVEVMGHEVVHTALDWALDNDSREAINIKRRVAYLRQEVLVKSKWQDFLVTATDQNGNPVAATTEDIRRAKEIYKYIFVGKNSIKEFMTYGLTNPAVIKHLKEVKLKNTRSNAFEKLREFFSVVIDIVMGKYTFGEDSKNAYDRTMSLAMELAEINNRAENTAITMDWAGELNNWIDGKEREFVDFADEFMEKLIPQEDRIAKLSDNAGVIETGIYFSKFMVKAFTIPAYSKAVGLMASKFGLPPESSLRELMGDILDESEAKVNANWLGMATNKMDNMRESMAGIVGYIIQKSMKRPMSAQQEIAITEVLIDTNVSSLLYGNNKISKERLVEVLNNDNELDKEIVRYEKEIKRLLSADKNRANWTVAQAHGLGYLMATNIGNTAQNTNALGIVTGVRYDKRFDNNENLLSLVKMLSSLRGLKYTDKEMKTQVAELLNTEAAGVKNIMDIYESFKTGSKNLFRDDPLHMMDGYTKEITDSTIEVIYAPLSEKEEMIDKGYEFKYEVKSRAGLTKAESIGIFISPNNFVSGRQRGALSLDSIGGKGTSLKEINFKADSIAGGVNFDRDKKIIEEYNKTLVDKMKQGLFNPTTVDKGMMATIDDKGKVVDYRYTMSKKLKKELLGLDKRVVITLARSMAAIADKELKASQEDKILKEIVRVMDEEWKQDEITMDEQTITERSLEVNSHTGTEFALIGPNVNEEKLKELYYMLPYKFREYIKSRDDKIIAVPRELLNIYFGYKHYKFTDFALVNELPKSIKIVLDSAEAIWIDLVKIAKETILLKMPAILVFNLISNFLFMMTKQVNPIELAKMHIDSFRDVQEYFKDSKTQTRLMVEISSLKEKLESNSDIGIVNETIYKKQTELDVITEKMNNNPIKELVDLGMNQTIVDDVNISAVENNNMIKDKLDSLMTNVPGIIKTPLQWLYLSKETAWYQVSSNILQASDLVARDIMNRREKYLEERQANGEKKLPKEYLEAIKNKYGIELPDQMVIQDADRAEFFEIMKGVRHYKLLKWFINYTQPSGKGEEYANKLGLLMFTKFVKRIQRTIFSSLKEHPIKTMGILMFSGFLLNVDTIHDQSYTTKGFDNDGSWSPFNIFPLYSPIDIIEVVVNPPLVNLVQEYS